VIGMGRTVGEVAALGSVSVRTLHHYDAIGLLSPSERSPAGYRLYGDDDLQRLQQVLFFRELGFGLAEIGRIMSDATFDRLEALLLQRRMLEEKARQIGHMIDAVSDAVDAMEKGEVMDDKDMFEVFGEFDPKQYEQEARERWGSTDAYKESTRRAKKYTKDDWKQIKDDQERVSLAFADAMGRGLPADSGEAMDLAEEHRLQIDRRFYPCSYQMHVGLGTMYVADPRFARHYDDFRPGLAQYVCDAIQANAKRAG
jgi:DNA-binding transcriptional MerR regulator